MATHLIDSSDVKLSVHERGAGLPILFLHGMWCNHHAFDDVVAGLAGGYRTVCPDLRGHGVSSVPSQAWSVKDLAIDQRRILDALAIEKTVVVGHSLGGMAALHMALHDPSRLGGLVLLSTSAAAEKPERRSQLSLMSMTINMGGMNRWLAGRVAHAFFSTAFARRSRGQVRAWRAQLRAMPKPALLQALAAVRDRPSVWDRLDAIATPTLVMGTRDDSIADPAHAADMARRLANAQLIMLPGSGHALPMEHPQELIKALGRFINEHI